MRRILALVAMATTFLTGCGGDDPGDPDPPTTGTVIVAIDPPTLAAGWSLTGPNGYANAGTGGVQLPDLEPGGYDITWLPVTDWTTPLPQSQTLVAGETITFTAVYTYDPLPLGTVTVVIEPDDVWPDWVLKVETGDGAHDRSGMGDATLLDVPTGAVTLDWEEIPGWSSPAPGYVTRTLAEGQVLVLTIDYTLLPAWPMEFVTVDAGAFAMGSPAEEPGASFVEWPRHDVTLTRDLVVSVAEITNAQWDEVMGGAREPSPTAANLPVTEVTWFEAVDFCNALSLDEGLMPAYTVDGDVSWNPDAAGYRLPTEAEWEYFARAGTSTALSAGELVELECEPDPVLAYYGWTCANASVKQPVRSLYPNDRGLYDVHGNAAEFCWDYYGEGYYDVSPAVDPAGPATGTYRIVRGGFYTAWNGACRSASRTWRTPGLTNAAVGFRIVRNAVPEKSGGGR